MTDGNTHELALYCLDYDNEGRSQSITISDTATGTVLDTRSMSGFTSGEYVVWNVSGNVTVKVSLLAGGNAVVSGLFFGGRSAGCAAGVERLDQHSDLDRLDRQLSFAGRLDNQWWRRFALLECERDAIVVDALGEVGHGSIDADNWRVDRHTGRGHLQGHGNGSIFGGERRRKRIPTADCRDSHADGASSAAAFADLERLGFAHKLHRDGGWGKSGVSKCKHYKHRWRNPQLDGK